MEDIFVQPLKGTRGKFKKFGEKISKEHKDNQGKVCIKTRIRGRRRRRRSETPSYFRVRDCMLGEIVFVSLGFNIYTLQERGFNEVDIIVDFLKEFNVMCKRGDSYDITKDLFEEDAFNEIKLREKLVKRRNKLNRFSCTCNRFNKSKKILQKKCHSIVREIETKQKDKLNNSMWFSREVKTNLVFVKKFCFTPDVEK